MNVIGGDALDWNEQLWRYFKIDRFVELIDTGRLYFSSAQEFEDRFEGAVTVMPAGIQVDPTYTEMESGESAFEQLRRLTKVSCWHRADYESDAMWKLYANRHKGVAIRSTPQRIREAAKPYRIKPEFGHEDLFGGNVEYVDLLKERLERTMLNRFYVKHKAFSWEREFRLVVSVRQAEEFGVQVPERGVLVDFDLDTLVDKIYLGPSLTQEDTERIRDAATRQGLADRIRVSSLLGTPRYIYP